MPKIYLSPSTQEGNPYITGGNEELYMNQIADAMVPYLRSSGILYTRNRPDMTAAQVIAQSNQGRYDLHLALHSNAAPNAKSGRVRGTDVYYYPSSSRGKRAASILAQNFKAIYPLPNLVRALPTTAIGEVSRTYAPAAFMEFAYHDNKEDADWIKTNIGVIARNVVLSLTEYFGLPFVNPMTPWTGLVATQSGPLNLRARPSTGSSVLTKIPRGTTVTVTGILPDWYVIEYKQQVGYAAEEYIEKI